MIKLKIKSGDIVRVIAGDHKGAEGKVLRVDREKTKPLLKVLIWFQNIRNQVQKAQGGIVKERNTNI
jgi:large subunit ribosomal protein L24